MFPNLSVNIQICDIPSNNVQQWVVKVLPIAQNLVRKEIHETIYNGDAFTAAASYASLATASTSHFWSIVPTYETSNVCWIPSEKKTKWRAILTMPVRVVLCPCKALKWEISMWIEILKWLSREVDYRLFFDQTCWCRAYPRSTGLCLKLPPICLPSGSASPLPLPFGALCPGGAVWLEMK